jgi:gamma-D-glutamyl-L-lysine dipeptidyl-peptidase
MNKQIMMQFGFCDLAAVPVRREPSDTTEMSTQLLFGDTVEVLEQSGSWLLVKVFFDGCQGWVGTKQLYEIGEEEFHRLNASEVFINRQLFGDSVSRNEEVIKLSAGSCFYNLKDQRMKIGEREYLLESKIYPFVYDGPDSLLKTAYNYLSCPYLWGGKTYLGLDCSGFTQVVYKQHGVSLLRDAAKQATQGELISFISDGRPGDLAFFDNEEGRICHVGILLDNQKIIHCSGKVRIDTIDHQGIFNSDLNKYSHSLRLIRRVVSR